MNNKFIIGLSIVIVLTIGIILLTIFKGENMWKWMKKNVCCCVGKKKEYEDIDDDTSNHNVRPVTTEEIDSLQKEFDDLKKDRESAKALTKSIHNQIKQDIVYVDEVIEKHEDVLKKMGVENIEEFVAQNEKK